jgi:hypothetical protein
MAESEGSRPAGTGPRCVELVTLYDNESSLPSRCHAATPEEVQRVIELCPSGALTREVPSE